MKKHVYRFAAGDTVVYRPEFDRDQKMVVTKLGGKWLFRKGKVLVAWAGYYGGIYYDWVQETLLERHYSPEEKAAFDKLMDGAQ